MVGHISGGTWVQLQDWVCVLLVQKLNKTHGPVACTHTAKRTLVNLACRYKAFFRLLSAVSV